MTTARLIRPIGREGVPVFRIDGMAFSPRPISNRRGPADYWYLWPDLRWRRACPESYLGHFQADGTPVGRLTDSYMETAESFDLNAMPLGTWWYILRG